MRFKDDVQDGSGSKDYVKLKDQESITGVFMGDPYEFSSVWEDGQSRVVKAGTPDAKFRFKINFIVKDGSTFTPKIFENGAKVYRQLKELHDEYELDKILVKVTRNGSGTDTTYSILPLLKQTINKETAEYLSKLELLPLVRKEQKAPSVSGNDETDEIPF